MAKVKVKVWFWVRLPGEPKTPALSLVTVWGASEVFTHFTCVPALIESFAGEKEYTPLFSTIFTVPTVELEADVGLWLGWVVAVAVGAEVGGVVAVGVEVVVVPPPPQATRRKAPMIASGRNLQDIRVRLAIDDRYVRINGTSSRFNGASLTNILTYG